MPRVLAVILIIGSLNRDFTSLNALIKYKIFFAGSRPHPSESLSAHRNTPPDPDHSQQRTATCQHADEICC